MRRNSTYDSNQKLMVPNGTTRTPEKGVNSSHATGSSSVALDGQIVSNNAKTISKSIDVFDVRGDIKTKPVENNSGLAPVMAKNSSNKPINEVEETHDSLVN